MSYKFVNTTRNYSEYYYYDSVKLNRITLDINPIENKLMNHDNFDIIDGNVKIIHSVVKETDIIPGVIIINNNKTYGVKNKKKLYKCIPDDIRLPTFLIPYDINTRTFSKKFNNKYVIFKYIEWNGKHPIGQIVNTIGDVNLLNNFYEYTLYCKSLNASITDFTKSALDKLKSKTEEQYIQDIMNTIPNIEDRINRDIYTIDSANCKDMDDGFGITKHNGKDVISIYITNVTLWINQMNLWDSFSKRVSTIYLPDRTRPMLPTILSECICSLKENETRFAFTLDITIENNNIVHHSFKNTLIKVKKNFIYDEESLKNNDDYNYLFNLVQNLNKTNKYSNKVSNSHDVILYLMVLMNYLSSKELVSFKNGIFRGAVVKSTAIVDTPADIPDDISTFINIWKNTNSAYCKYDNAIQHDILKLESYVHITSPIRRLVDLLNMYKLQQNLNIANLNGEKFYNNWLSELDYINTSMRSIRKIQIDCDLLHLCTTNNSVLEEIYDGYIFDKIEREDKLFQYIVYLPKLKLLSRLTMRENIDNYKCGKFKLFIFNDEANFKRKVRIQMI